MEQEQPVERPLRQLVDVTTEILRADNYIPLLHCLKENKFPWERYSTHS